MHVCVQENYGIYQMGKLEDSIDQNVHLTLAWPCLPPLPMALTLGRNAGQEDWIEVPPTTSNGRRAVRVL